jgi:hypothetical protein
MKKKAYLGWLLHVAFVGPLVTASILTEMEKPGKKFPLCLRVKGN